MIPAALFAATLLVAVATDPRDDAIGGANLSAPQKSAATQPFVHSATDCIAHAVIADPRYGKNTATEPGEGAELGNLELGNLIVASMPACVTPVRAMIDAYDRYYGDGSGEAFFMGPYLDVLPQAIVAAGKKAAAP
jgi:hypothetical protein